MKINLYQKPWCQIENNILVNSLLDLRFPICYLEYNEEIKNVHVTGGIRLDKIESIK